MNVESEVGETIVVHSTMQAVTAAQQSIVAQASSQVVEAQGVQAHMQTVMQQAPQQPSPSPHAATNSIPQQSPQHYYVQATVGSGMQPGPPAIAPAPAPQTSTSTVSALHQPLHHPLAPQQLAHPGVSPSPMPQFPTQVQVIQGGLPGGPYLQQVYQNAQGQIIMPGNLTLQPATGMNATPLQQNALNSLSQPVQVIAANKPFPGQITPHMLAANKGQVIQASGQAVACNPSAIPTTGNQTFVIGQLGVISSQPTSILPAHSTAAKPGEMPKGAAFGSLQQGITWAAPGTLHSPTLLTTQNQQFIIRGAPGQENVFIQSPQPQAVPVPTTMMSQITSMPQQAKQRSGIDIPASIQPKTTIMRPPILPNMSVAQVRPGASVSTQTATGVTLASTQMGSTRTNTKVRGKNTANRASPAMAGPPQITPAQQITTGAISVAQTIIPAGAAMATQMALTTVAQPVPQTLVSSPVVLGKVNGQIQSMGNVAKVCTPLAPPMAPLTSVGTQSMPQTLIRVNGVTKASQPSSQAVSISGAPTAVTMVSASQPTASAQAAVQTITSSMAPVAAVASNTATPSTSSVATSTISVTMISESPTPIITSALPNAEVKVDAKKEDSNAQLHFTGTSTLPNGVSNPSANENSEVEITRVASPVVTLSTNKNVGNQPTCNGPPKALVKPQVLTHVIEGYVIHEASEPFPVSRTSLLADLSKSKGNSTVTDQSEKENLPDECKGLDMPGSPRGDMAKCEVCGKVEARYKLKRKRFCSTVCARKFSVNSTKRAGLTKSDESPNKKLRGEGDGELDNVDAVLQQEISGNNFAEEEKHVQQILESPSKSPKIDFVKWSVKDVVEFIQNLPGCQDYAEDFALQEIDGQALMLLKADHLMTAMSMKLGPALKICAKIESMKGERKES